MEYVTGLNYIMYKLFSFLWKYWVYIFIPIFICDCTLSYCVDIHSKRRIVGGYFLYVFNEGGELYYVNKGIWDLASDGGVFKGTIQEIGWNKDWIVARVERQGLPRVDPSGWFVLEVKKGRVISPITYENLAKNTNWASIKCVPASESYKSLVVFEGLQ